MKSGHGKWVVAAFRTDYRIKTENGVIPCEEHLQRNYRLVREADVSDEAVEFAVKSERERNASVDDMAEILKNSLASGDKAAGFRDFMALLEHERLEEEDPDAEERIGEEINKILSQTGGLS